MSILFCNFANRYKDFALTATGKQLTLLSAALYYIQGLFIAHKVWRGVYDQDRF
jgi:hypothetical protein